MFGDLTNDLLVYFPLLSLVLHGYDRLQLNMFQLSAV